MTKQPYYVFEVNILRYMWIRTCNLYYRDMYDKSTNDFLGYPLRINNHLADNEIRIQFYDTTLFDSQLASAQKLYKIPKKKKSYDMMKELLQIMLENKP